MLTPTRSRLTGALFGAAAVFVVLGSFAAAGQQGRIAEPPTPAQLMALENIQKLESKIVFDHEDYLPSERAVFTVTIGVAAALPWILELTFKYVPNVAVPEAVSGFAVSVWVIVLSKKMLKA